MTRLLILAFLFIVPTSLTAQDAKKKNAKPSAEELYKSFSKQMKNVKLVGKFTIVGKDQGNLPDEEYEISSAKKLPIGSKWLITSRIKYGTLDVNIPVPVDVEFAGDTPVISLTNATIPTLGTFPCRVVIYNNKYAGTWTHGKVGGHMFGTVVKAQPAKKVPAPKKQK